jgi:hypothetical protein
MGYRSCKLILVRKEKKGGNGGGRVDAQGERVREETHTQGEMYTIHVTKTDFCSIKKTHTPSEPKKKECQLSFEIETFCAKKTRHTPS